MPDKPATPVSGSVPTSAAKADPPASSQPAVEATTASTGTSSENVPKANARKPAYTNPAFKAMGLPPLRLPSRNWSIFWAVVSFGIGGYAYDRYQVRQIRKKWMDRVSKYGDAPLPPNVKARRVTVYVAPPPNDYLDESLTVFRRYVKPVLNAGGVDFEIKSENRQGVIRSLVAADVRAIRRDYLESLEKVKADEEAKKWYNKVKSWFTKSKKPELTQEEIARAQSLDFDYKQLLGTYYQNQQWKDAEIIEEDSLIADPAAQGGIICVGRGAYKEYLHGLHEGLLGPLEKPLDHDEFDNTTSETEGEKPVTERTSVETVVAPTVVSLDEMMKEDEVPTEAGKTVEKNEESIGISPETAEESTEKEEDKKDNDGDDEDKDENGEKQLPIPKPFIDPSDYKQAPYAPELPTQGIIKTRTGVSAAFQQPIAVIPVYHLLGFLQMPWRIYRFYTQRNYAEDYGRCAVAVVENIRSRYTVDDVDLAKREEEDWPKKWVEKGKQKGSEWTQDLAVDERVLEKLWVFDSSGVVDKVEKKQ